MSAERRLPAVVRAVVSEQCMINRGEDGALDEACRRVLLAARDVVNRWGRPLAPKLHFVLEVERPDTSAAPAPPVAGNAVVRLDDPALRERIARAMCAFNCLPFNDTYCDVYRRGADAVIAAIGGERKDDNGGEK